MGRCTERAALNFFFQQSDYLPIIRFLGGFFRFPNIFVLVTDADTIS